MEDIGEAVQGRYMFPVLSCFIILIVYGIWNFFSNKKYATIILLSISLFFIYSDVFYVIKIYDVWYVSQEAQVVEKTEDINIGETSLSQNFTIDNDAARDALGIYISSNRRNLYGGFVFNLYNKDCKEKIESVEIGKIIHNNFSIVQFENLLESEEMYCFNIKNTGSKKPIQLKYAMNDLSGNIVGDERRDVFYSSVIH